MRERGKMEELTQNVAHDISTDLIHWGEKEEREYINVSKMHFSIDNKKILMYFGDI